jgi:hypothetical protein
LLSDFFGVLCLESLDFLGVEGLEDEDDEDVEAEDDDDEEVEDFLGVLEPDPLFEFGEAFLLLLFLLLLGLGGIEM